MPHPLPPSARAWQEKVRRFVDEELIPFEVEAEMNGGVLPEAVRQRQRSRAKAIGLHALGIPKEHGGQGLTALEQAVIQEQIGRVTNALGWCYSSTPPWMLEACAGNDASDEDLGARRTSAASGMNATPSPRSMPAPTSTPSGRRRGATATTTC